MTKYDWIDYWSINGIISRTPLGDAYCHIGPLTDESLARLRPNHQSSISALLPRTELAVLVCLVTLLSQESYAVETVSWRSLGGHVFFTDIKLSIDPDKQHERKSIASGDHDSSLSWRWYRGSIISSTMSAINGRSKIACETCELSSRLCRSYCCRSKTEGFSRVQSRGRLLTYLDVSICRYTDIRHMQLLTRQSLEKKICRPF